MVMMRTLGDMLINEPSRGELLMMDDSERLIFQNALEKDVVGKGKQKRDEKAINSSVARQVYGLAKVRFAEEKERHRIVEEGFVGEKARHKEERERFKAATAQFQKDAYAWKCIRREERMIKTARSIEDDNMFDEGIERLKEKYEGTATLA